MINSELSEISYVIQAGVTTYPIGFEYHFNENNSPQLLVKIGESVAIINVDFQLSADESEIILIPTEEEARAQTSPNDTRWMDRIVGKELLITRDIPFVQTSDYTVGRISPEQIEYDFDRTVMRDQEILHKLNDFTVDVALAESLANAAVETANEAATAANQATATANTVLETANNAIVTANDAKAVATQASQDAVDAIADSANAVNKAEAADMTATTAMEIAAEAVTVAQGAEAAVANKQDKLTAGTNVSIVGTTINVDGYSKAQIDNKVTIIEADVDANADAIQKTRADFISADSDIHTILNNHAGELTTLHNDVDAVGDQVSGIEEKIPGTASASNPLVTKQQLLDEEMDIREDLNSGLSELQTQVTAQAAEIAGKQDELTAGANITIVDGVISSTGGAAEFPDQTNKAGRFLQTDGTSVSWSPNLTINESNSSVSIGVSSEAVDSATSIGGTYAVASGEYSVAVGSSAKATKMAAVAVGYSSEATANSAVSIGFSSEASGISSSAVGNASSANGFGSTAIGYFASASAQNSVQIGRGTNTSEGSLQFKDYTVVSNDGTIPTDRYTTTPTSAGTYIPKLTIAEDGTVSREWGTESGGGASGDFLPLAGGTMTGSIEYNHDFGETTGIQTILKATAVKTNRYTGTITSICTLNFTDNGLLCLNNKDGGFDSGESYFMYDSSSISVKIDGGCMIGGVKQRLGILHTKSISSTTTAGLPKLITVPENREGTMALVEDIDAALGDKATIAGWGMPDYSAGVSFTPAVDTTFTAPTDGVALVYFKVTGGNGNLVFNGTTIGLFGGSNANHNNFSLPMNKGDTITITMNAGSPDNSIGNFYPLKGVNQ